MTNSRDVESLPALPALLLEVEHYHCHALIASFVSVLHVVSQKPMIRTGFWFRWTHTIKRNRTQAVRRKAEILRGLIGVRARRRGKELTEDVGPDVTRKRSCMVDDHGSRKEIVFSKVATWRRTLRSPSRELLTSDGWIGGCPCDPLTDIETVSVSVPDSIGSLIVGMAVVHVVVCND